MKSFMVHCVPEAENLKLICKSKKIYSGVSATPWHSLQRYALSFLAFNMLDCILDLTITK